MTIAAAPLARLVDPVDQLVFAVALAELDRQTELGCGAAAERLDVGERLAAVDLRLALAEQVEVRPVENGDGAAHGKQALQALKRAPRRQHIRKSAGAPFAPV